MPRLGTRAYKPLFPLGQTKGDDMIVGRVGDRAYLDSFSGLAPCTVIEIRDDGHVVVDFEDTDDIFHWSGMTKNVWRGHKGEIFSKTQVVPAKAMRDVNTITSYRWEKGPAKRQDS